jgi:hypothetical protein
MKARFLKISLFVVMLALFNTSCVITNSSHSGTLEEASKMPPFDATLEKIDYSYRFIHPFQLAPEVDLYTKTSRGGLEMRLWFFPASPSVVNFAHTLHEGQQYSFPKVFSDYIGSQSTNTIKQ